MDINITIKGMDPIAEAINNIATAMAGARPPTVELVVTKDTTTAPETTPAEPLKGSDLKKFQISEEIKALGGTPPEKGSVAKFEAALEKLKSVEAANGEPEEKAEESTTDEGEEVDVAEVRTLAMAAIKKHPDNAAKGKAAFAGALKLAKAENLTDATQAQLKKVVPMLEEYVGKTLAEVVAEAGD